MEVELDEQVAAVAPQKPRYARQGKRNARSFEQHVAAERANKTAKIVQSGGAHELEPN